MLVLTRKPGEKIIIAGNITISVVEVSGQRVRIAIDAPRDVRILRSELRPWDEPAATPEAGRNAEWSEAPASDSGAVTVG